MTFSLISPFATPDPNLPIRQGAPQLTRPNKEDSETYAIEAQQLLANNWTAQKSLLESGQYDLRWLEGRHVLLAGAAAHDRQIEIVLAIGLRKVDGPLVENDVALHEIGDTLAVGVQVTGGIGLP